ncbi:MAG: low molecular weight phosphatase family protein, partial [Stellaceae bacterium]
MSRAPGSVLFACTLNSIRSPIAAALLRKTHGRTIFVDSVGVRTAPVDPFAVAVMTEIGIDLATHQPKSFDDLEDTSFDLVISLSPDA